MIAVSVAGAEVLRGRPNELRLLVTNRSRGELEDPVVRLSLASLFTSPA